MKRLRNKSLSEKRSRASGTFFELLLFRASDAFLRFHEKRVGREILRVNAPFKQVQAKMLRSEKESGKEPEETLVVAVPKNIGCALAGGKWTHYEGFLKAFHASLSQKVALEVRVCKRPMRCEACAREPLEENVDGWDSKAGFYCKECWEKWEKRS